MLVLEVVVLHEGPVEGVVVPEQDPAAGLGAEDHGPDGEGVALLAPLEHAVVRLVGDAHAFPEKGEQDIRRAKWLRPNSRSGVRVWEVVSAFGSEHTTMSSKVCCHSALHL